MVCAADRETIVCRRFAAPKSANLTWPSWSRRILAPGSHKQNKLLQVTSSQKHMAAAPRWIKSRILTCTKCKSAPSCGGSGPSLTSGSLAPRVHIPNDIFICSDLLAQLMLVPSTHTDRHTHTHARMHAPLTALCPGLPGWAGTRKVKPIWILLKQETVSGNGISWAICKSAPRSRQITTPASHHSVFYRPDALPAAQPTASKHWGHRQTNHTKTVTTDCIA